MIIIANRVYQHWSEIFNHDTTLASALLDRLFHDVETIFIKARESEEISAITKNIIARASRPAPANMPELRSTPAIRSRCSHGHNKWSVRVVVGAD